MAMDETSATDRESIPVEAERLRAFLGDWDVHGTLTAGKNPAAVAGRWHFAKAADGWGAQGEMTTEIEGMGAFEEHELIGFDPIEKKVHMISMNKFAIRDHSGDWQSETQLSVVYAAMVDGHEANERISLDFGNPNGIRGRLSRPRTVRLRSPRNSRCRGSINPIGHSGVEQPRTADSTPRQHPIMSASGQ
jgi:hypothetical protein